MALTNFRSNQPETTFDSNLCSVPSCSNWWAVKIDKPMCSHHQWANTEKSKKVPILPNYPKKDKKNWYDEVEF